MIPNGEHPTMRPSDEEPTLRLDEAIVLPCGRFVACKYHYTSSDVVRTRQTKGDEAEF